MDDNIRWTVKVSPETDRSLRSYLGQHGMKKGDLSKFIERAVQKEILTQTAAEVKRRNADLTGDQLQALIDEAVAAVRKESRAESRATANHVERHGTGSRPMDTRRINVRSTR